MLIELNKKDDMTLKPSGIKISRTPKGIHYIGTDITGNCQGKSSLIADDFYLLQNSRF